MKNSEDDCLSNKLFDQSNWRQALSLLTVSFFLVVICSGCSSVDYGTDNPKSTGLRYYDSAPYLLVCSDGHGGLKWTILYLPDQSIVKTVTPATGWAHTEMTLNFQNGVLMTSSTMSDSTEIPKSIISAVQSALPAIAAAAAESSKLPSFPAPYLYKLAWDGGTLQFIGQQGDARIQVPLDNGGPYQ
jgi:uncharacterized protein YceK